MIKEEIFAKMTKKQKLEMPIISLKKLEKLKEEKTNRILFIPIRKKMDGYGKSAIFICINNKWIRVKDYDSFSIHMDTIDRNRHYIKGDFEYNGVVIFIEKKIDLITFY